MSNVQEQLVKALKMTYRKHVLMDDSVGWGELTTILCDAICNAEGDQAFQDWLDELSSETS